MLGPALALLAERHPRLEFEVDEMEPEVALDRLRLGDVDLVLADEYERPRPRHQQLDFQPLCEDPAAGCAAGDPPARRVD
jgi:DNA-binding transcriptional LysR family regulator